MITQRVPIVVAVVAFLAGLASWVRFFGADLTLSHYDAKAHLVVARRVIDNITPGWQQIGAVWLPLPHLLQMLPTQVDVLYRTGAFGSLLSVLAFTATAWAAARFVLLATGSWAGASTTAALIVVNPNLLYLQSTPMTEPLLLAAACLVVLWMYEWLTGPADGGRHIPRRLQWALAAAAWTRYEAWPVLAAAVVVAAVALLRRGAGARCAAVLTLRLAVWPAAAVLLFVLNSRVTTGEWLVTGGFFEIDATYRGRLLKSLVAVWWGTHRLSGYATEILALGTAVWLVMSAARHAEAAPRLLPISLLAAGALPSYAFFGGHPFRIRYMVVLVVGCALLCGVAVGLVRRRGAAVLLCAGLVAASLLESPLWGLDAPMIEEARLDVPRTLERRRVTACLRGRYRGEKILASMGSLAHYMQELSSAGLRIADFIHEGNGAIWTLALTTGPAPHAGWMILEEQSEGGDILARRVREDPRFVTGMVRVCEGGGVALYRRQ